ncbi:MAG TPA: PQQ-binding-like beta-propeller repeat protein [Anaeromyxobacteraceae bacterium]
MVRIRIGSTWKQDPSLRSALARGGDVALEAATGAVDALAVEVDGIDVAAGHAEGALVAGVEALGEAVLRLLAGSARAQVHFSEGGVELVLGRRGASALVTVVALGRPARVLARDVEVDLAELARAAREAAGALADELATLQPSAAAAVTRSLRRLASRLGAARPAPAIAPGPPGRPSTQRPAQREHAPTCTFELRDEDGLLASYRGPGADLGSLLPPGRVVLRAADGSEVIALSGPPFLVLRDLAAFAARLADGVRRGEATASVALAAPGRHATVRLEADLEAGTLAPDGGAPFPCAPLPLARALLEAAVDFCGVVAARNAWQADNGWLAELRTGAAERLAHVQELLAGDLVADEGANVRRRGARRLPRAPLGPGCVRRLAFRRAWEADAGAPAGFGLALAGDLVLAAGAAAVLGLDARRGDERWRRDGVTFAALGDGALFAVDASRLSSLDPVTGRERWSRPLSALPEGGVRAVVRLSGGLALVVGPGAATALDPASGRTAWTFAPPAALDLRAAALGALALLGTDAGFLYGVEAATGRTAWRLRLPGPLVAAPAAHGDACLALCATELGGSLVAVDPSTGRRRFEAPLDVAPVGPPVTFAGLLAVGGTVAGDPVVTAIELTGALAWEDGPPLGAGAAALAPLPSGLLVKTAGGACVALGRCGETLWSHARDAAHPPPANAPAVVARGVALVPGEQVDALDAATGKLLGHARVPAPVRLVADAGLAAWGMDAEGVVTAVRLETHLSVL